MRTVAARSSHPPGEPNAAAVHASTNLSTRSGALAPSHMATLPPNDMPATDARVIPARPELEHVPGEVGDRPNTRPQRRAAVTAMIGADHSKRCRRVPQSVDPRVRWLCRSRYRARACAPRCPRCCGATLTRRPRARDRPSPLQVRGPPKGRAACRSARHSGPVHRFRAARRRNGIPASADRDAAAVTSRWASSSPAVRAAANATLSARIRPPVASRFWRIRWVSTRSAGSTSAIAAIAPPEVASASLSASHSACHAPAARSCGWGSPATSRAQWSRARVAHAKARTDPAGLRLCGMVDEPPASAFRHLAHLGLGEQHDVRPDLGRPSGDRGQRGTDLNQRDSVGVP